MSSSFPYLPPAVAQPQRVAADTQGAYRDLFMLTATFLPLNASAADFRNLQIQADSDFLLAMISGEVKNLVTDEVVIAAPAITIEIVSSGSGRILMDSPVPWSVIVGTAQLPFILPTPKTFSANSTIVVRVVNAIAVAKQVRLTLHGYKLFSGF